MELLFIVFRQHLLIVILLIIRKNFHVESRFYFQVVRFLLSVELLLFHYLFELWLELIANQIFWIFDNIRYYHQWDGPTSKYLRIAMIKVVFRWRLTFPQCTQQSNELKHLNWDSSNFHDYLLVNTRQAIYGIVDYVRFLHGFSIRLNVRGKM